MSTMTATSAVSVTDRGVIGGRELVAIQTIDIARLTPHVTPIVPGAFIAISGRGPKGDSNGSGKTSFQAAVTVLLADPQWRFDINGGALAAGLLFQAASAGLDVSYSADHGYIIGVFADPDFPMPDTSVTVWVRLQTTSPHLTVRSTRGIVVVDADNDDARYKQANDLWASLPKSSQCSARKMSETLYGDAPRCLAFLDTPLRKAAPSLLSQAMTDMSPTDIGQALIDLAGMRHSFDAEQDQRNNLAGMERALIEARLKHQEQRRIEDAELAAIRNRTKARERLTYGAHMWRLHFAKRLVDAVPEHARLTGELVDANDTIRLAKEDVDRARAALTAVKNDQDAQRREREAKDVMDQARGAVERIDAAVNEWRGRINGAEEKRPALQHAAHGWDGASVEDATAARAAAVDARATARVRATQAAERAAAAESTLEQAKTGRSPRTTNVIDALQAAGVGCVGLADTVTLDETARAYWEPLLWPWRDAIVVSGDQLSAAVRAVAHLPGTTLVAADDATRTAAAPAGVQSAAPLGAFLSTLAARSRHEHDPHRTHDLDAGIVTVGGFDAPVTGRDARVAQAQAALDAAVSEADAKAGELAAAERDLTEAERRLEVATAAHDLAALEAAITVMHERIEEAAKPRPATFAEYEAAEAQWKVAVAAVSGHQSRVLAAEMALNGREKEHADAVDDRARLQTRLDKLNITYWTLGWGGTVEDAQVALDAEPEDVRNLKHETIRHRATDALAEAIDAYGHDTDLSDDIAAIKGRRSELEPEEGREEGAGKPFPPSFAELALPLQTRLDGSAERDLVIGAGIERDRAHREQTLAELTTEMHGASRSLTEVQDMIERSVESRFARMSTAFNTLTIQHGGFGGELLVVSERPETATGAWKWRVTPQWRRARGAKMVSYQQAANGAQIKVAAFHVTLSALIAGDPDARAGQVLVIDELGNSLGDVNRRDVLKSLQSVAESNRVTILGVCQDSVLDDAVTASRELLWFTHASVDHPYNQPVKAWGYDDERRRVDLLGEQVRAGRPWL